ncbi:unnamed protein product [Adineta steineri]|uniref:Carrier domain-containing protein n=1 Tax=Adineta steineri TaxID=433720 RepID=A0A815CLE8_9BILA|nr:unnamed protein product [Adineta steineri]CAF1285625.1 unnamed protein product [Adineta steineri]
MQFAAQSCQVWNLYGPAEATLGTTCHLIDVVSHMYDLPIGKLLPRYICLPLNNFLQSVMIQEEGELLVGGLGVFAGYLGRDDLTAKALVQIDDQLFYRTGDLVRMDSNGLLHYQGRKDHQIKLHGQRIELGEIERCLLNITSISTCVVIKWNDDYLVAYVQSSHISEGQLRQHCQSHLPSYMIPSFFVILEKLPLNQNGKIDRKLLPPPHFSSIHLTNSIELLVPTNDIEVSIHHIWCEIFNQNQISTDTNIFTIGGHSLLMMQLFHRYKIEFHLEPNTLSISNLFQHPTIIHHAQLIQQSINTILTLDDYSWSSLHLIQATASFAQERIYLDEQIRFSSNKTTMSNMYVIPLLYRILSMNDHVSITRLHHAFQSVIAKHNILRTALYIDDTNDNIMQHCSDTNVIVNDDMKSYGLTIINLHNDDHRHMNEIIDEILNQSDLFDLSQGRVIRCHILRHCHQSQDRISYENDDLLTENDHILISIHHAMFDGASTSIFLGDLSLAYQSNNLLPIDDNSFQYIDYSIHEHIMNMTLPQEFWQLELKGYNLVRQLSLPVDRQRSSTNQQRSGLASSAQIIFDDELCISFLNYASSHHLTLFQLGLSIFYVFLFKLTHGETDLCISSINANRYRSELVNMIGMFVSILPYHVELDPHWSFNEVVRYVQEKCLSILEHSHYPLQHILSDLHVSQSNVSFLETIFDFITISNENNDLCLDRVNVEQVSLNQSYEMAKFDFSLTFVYNPSSDDNQLSCSFVCSRDIFDTSTAAIIGRRLKYLCEQIFDNKSTPASFAQYRIWSGNQRDADTDHSSLITHNVSFFYRFYTGAILSVEQLRHAFQLVVNKHESLHTSLIYDSNKNLLMQRVLTQQDINNDMVTITKSTYETDEQLNDIIENEKCNPHLFDLTQGLVFRCHIIYYKQISSTNIFSDKDIIIFNFHHAFFDYPSMNIFLHDLDQAYKIGQLTTDNATTLRYIDYAVVEQQMSMTGASMFWLDTLYDSHLDQSLSLPYDRYRLMNKQRTDRRKSVSFDFGQDLSHHFLTYASSNNIKYEHLALAIYYVYLFKLTNGEKDLCIAMNIDNRYRDELKSIIGLFENIIPLRCQLDPHWTFHYLLDYVQEMSTNSMKYSYYPLQRILNQHLNVSKPAFLDISFQFVPSMTSRDNQLIMIGNSQLSSIPFVMNINDNEIRNKYDFSLIIQHDLNINQFTCTINGSLDLFNVQTIDKISQRFHSILNQLFTSVDDQMNKSIYEISLTLPNERLHMQSINNTQVSFSSPVTCIHHEFVCQVMKHPQKLAVELDEQSLTYCELLYYVQVSSLHLINKHVVVPGEIICECVDRSLSMVIGIMAIEMAGGVYCPLSPRDPQHRLRALTEQSQSRLVIVHWLTKTKFNNDNLWIDIQSILFNNDVKNDVDVDRLSSITVMPNDIAYIIFTSGSTGTPKAVQVRHKNFIDCINSLVYINSFNKDDTVVQMTRCSFDIHVQEILGTLLVGGTLIMLHPGGIIDFDYLTKGVFIVVGEPFSVPLISFIVKVGITNCIVWNLYGPAETTIDCTFHRINVANNKESIPIGIPLSNYRCMIINQYLQSSVTDQEGELFVGGVGVFASYLGRHDLTAKALVEIDGQLFYRTGDIVTMDNYGLIHYQGRKDYQVKLHGQRIELGEIEQSLLRTSISACVVIKWSDDHLIAYVQSPHIDEKQLREHCQSHLPLHMNPSIFIVLDKLPLNANGKIDRKLLPPPHFSSAHLTNSLELLLPTNDIKVSIHHIWCDVFKQNQISVDTNMFTIGGHSLIMMQLFHRYKIQFHLETDSLSISNLFQHPTIIGHAQLIYQTMNVKENINDYHWSSLHIMKAKASFAQERIFLDEQIRFSSTNNNTNVYVIPLIYRVSSMNDHISISRLQHAFQSIIRKHQILRTALYLDANGTIIQHCLDTDTTINDKKSSRFLIINLSDEEHKQNEIVKKILNLSDLFDLSRGHVINCHILRHHQSHHSFTHNNVDLLTKDDLILFTIHHTCFDGASVPIFIRDFSLAYQSNELLPVDDNSLQYVDYSIYEHIMDMTVSQEFWQLELKGYNLTRQLLLPVDRQRSSTNQLRSGLASSAQITFDDEICTSFLNYASSHHLTLFQLGLSIFYVFLFKLTHGETDLCISSINANRYRSELVNMIGMFVSTLPFRVEIDSQWSFDEVVKYVREKCLSILEHSHYPLQHILSDLHLTQSNTSFLEIMFDFITVSKYVEHLCLNDTDLEQVLLEQSTEVSKFDFSLTFEYNVLLDNKRLSCGFICSCDLFEKLTISIIAQRFQHMLQQLFQTQSSNIPMMNANSSISELSLILPEEAEEMKVMLFHRLENIVNEAPASFAQARIWLDEKIQFDPEKPQIAIYNMPFVYRLQPVHTLSVKQLRHALHLTVNKHPSLHTSLHFDIQKNLLMQQVITHEDKNENNNIFSIIETTYETDEQINDILHDEKRNSHLFNLAHGLVFRCRLVYYKQISSNHLLSHKDLLIFNFHHALFDFSSMNIFLHDLNQAYTTNQLLYDENTNLRYLDYAVIEQQMSMTGASMFWLDVLHDCKLDQPLSLPFDRYRLSNEYRTGRGTSISFDFGQDLSHDFLTHTSANSISLEHLALATYYVFLFKLTNGEKDLCIGINTLGRYRDELNSIIGMFVNAIPLRCQLDPHLSFHKVTKHVQNNMINSIKYSYFPLQHILNQHPNISNPVFLDTSFDFVSSMRRDEENEIMIGDSRFSLLLDSIKISENEIMSKCDLNISFHHDLNVNEFSCTINASLDLFNVETVCIIAQRFQTMLHQQLTSFDCTTNKPIYELSLILSNEQYLMQSLNNTQIPFSSTLTCIHHEFVYQVMKHPQKVAVELDEQSLTYCELLYYVQVLSFTLLNEYHVIPGEIVCQCVERSLSMVIGIMGIEMAGGVYCPLSPRDPQHRLHALTQQTQSRLIFAHYLTKAKFNDDIVVLDIDSILVINDVNSDMDNNCFSSVLVEGEEIAYIIFTSGSTGTPKAVQVRHKNFIDCINSLAYINSFNKDDTVVQMTRCSFDIHVQEILGTLLVGGTLIMLHPGGTIDFDYLTKVLQNKQITYLHTVPSLLHSFFTFIEQNNNPNVLKHLRSLCSSGEPFSVALIGLTVKIGITNCIVWNLYGPAEATIGSTIHSVDVTSDTQSIPIGRPFYNYRGMIINQYLQTSATDQQGELFVGGAGVFASYLGRQDLTAKDLLEIDGVPFYRTGDLVHVDNNGLIHYVGRKDFQIKLHGQRIELGEIERSLLETTISACVVIKWNDDHLVAYIQSSHINEKQLREHCQSHLPSHMTPSVFVILDRLPLNANGKIDRKLLPPPSFSPMHLTSHDKLLLPTNDIEVSIHHIWCEIFKQNQISTNTNIFTIGGHSLLMMQLFHQYKIEFHLGQNQNTLSISDLFQHPTIIGHAQLIYQTMNVKENINDYHWSPLHIMKAKASFAQERIFLDEQIRFSSANNNTNMYVIPLIYRISTMNDHISISRLQHAFQSIITKHQTLRTALYLDTNGTIIQHCLDTNAIINDKKSSRFSMTNLPNDEHEHNEIVKKILSQSDLFDLSKGYVINCHILCQNQSNRSFTHNNNDVLTKDDLILFTFHHACFDGASTSIFIRDLSLAYQSNNLLPIDDNSFQYIDYSIHEHIMDMTLSQEFWLLKLKGYNLTRQISLPVDRQRSSINQQRSSLASIAQITFDDEICISFLTYASSHHLTLFQLGLSIFYVFLFKLTHGETDLCISSINANRYRSELVNMIGMFVSTLPYRVELDSQWSFDEVVRYVQEKCLSILEHSHYPLQHILADLHLTQSNVSFLETMFDFITISDEDSYLCLNGVNLQQVSLSELYEMAKFDFSVNFTYNSSSDDNQLSCSFACSSDLFDERILTIIGRRFQYMFQQLFQTQSSNIPLINGCSSIDKVSLILSEEAEEIELIVFDRLKGILSEVQHLRHALQLIVKKHESLRTSLVLHKHNNRLMQQIIDLSQNDNTLFSFSESIYTTHEQLNDILHDEKRNPHLFDLAEGLVFRCHLVYHKQISSNDLLSDKDLLIFNFHHALFDYPSMNIFLHDLNQAYTTGQLLYDDNTNLRYLDYAVIEQQMSMTGASMFWFDTLHDCKLDQSLSLPFDRYRLSNEHRTSRRTSISFDFGQDLSHEFLTQASSNNISLEHLTFAIYFIFLFKLTKGQTDLCLAMNINNNRYRDELKSIIGLFENIIPLRCQLNPHSYLHQLFEHIREITTNSMKYSYFPLQRILNQHPDISKYAFLDTFLEFTSNNSNNVTMIGDSQLLPASFSFNDNEDEILDIHDLSLLIHHDMNMNKLSCTINASLDLFNRETVEKISQRFHSILHQLLASMIDNQMNKPIYELSLTLSKEQYMIQSLNNTQISYSSALTCIHHEFVKQVKKHPQKLAVELDEQSLTYCELLYYVQVLSLTLLNEYYVTPGEIVCQCAERSLSMVIGIMSILMAGGVYCSLSPRDPEHRLHEFIQQTQSRLVLVHWLTKMKFNNDILSADIHSILANNDVMSDADFARLSSITVTPNNIAFIIFTSGSTGIPKAVSEY